MRSPTISRRAFTLAGGLFGGQVANIGLLALALRHMNVGNFGEAVAAIGIANILVDACDFGAGSAILRHGHTSNGDVQRECGRLISFKLGWIPILMAVAIVVGLPSHLLPLCLGVAALVAVRGIQTAVIVYLQRLQRYGQAASVNTFDRVAALGAVFISVESRHRLSAAVLPACYAWGTLAAVLFGLLISKSYRGLPIRWSQIRRPWLNWREGPEFGLGSLVPDAVFLDGAIVVAIAGGVQGGYFGLAARLIWPVTALAVSFSQAALPVLPKEWGARLALRRLIKSIRLPLVVVLATLIIAALVADPAIPWVFGSSYAPSVPVVRLYLVASALLVLCQMFMTALQASGRAGAASITAAVATIAQVTAVALGAYLHGGQGAATAFLAVNGVYLAGLIWLVLGTGDSKVTVGRPGRTTKQAYGADRIEGRTTLFPMDQLRTSHRVKSRAVRSPARTRPVRNGGLRSGLGPLVTLGAVVALPLVVLPHGPRLWSADTALAAYAVLIYSGARLVILSFHRPVPLVSSMFHAFVYVWFGLAGSAQASTQRSPLGVAHTDSVARETFVLVLAGAVAYDFAHGIEGFWRPRRITPDSPPRSFDVGRLRLLTWTLVPMSFALVELSGGLRYVLFTSRASYVAAIFGGDLQASKATGAIVNALITVPPFVATIGWILVRRKVIGTGGRLKPYDRVAAWGTWAAALVIENPVGQTRFWIATVYISVILICVRPQSPLRLYIVPLMVVALVFVYPYADVFRYTGPTAGTHGSPATQLIEKGDFDAFNQVEAAVDYVREFGYLEGHQLLGAVTFFVPRSVEPSKATDTGILLGQAQGTGNDNLSAPLWAEGFIDGGVPLMLLYLLLLGMLAGRLDRRGAVGFMVPIFCVYQIVLLRGSLIQSMGTTVGLFGLLFVITRVEGVARADRARSPMAGNQRLVAR